MQPPIQHDLSVAAAARRRRSIRRYKPEPIARETLTELLEVAGRAPSAWNLQPWRFVVVTEPERKARLQEAANGQKQVGAAAAVIVLYSDMQDTLANLDAVMHPTASTETRGKAQAGIRQAFAGQSRETQEDWGARQAGIALGYLLLALESHGYGSSPMLGFNPAAVKALFELPEHVPISALVAVGLPDEPGRESHRRPTSDLVRWDPVA